MTIKIDTSKKPSRFKHNPACIKHFCMAAGCEEWGIFGLKVCLKNGDPGLWFCRGHIAEAARLIARPSWTPSSTPDHLLPQPKRAQKARRERALKKDQGRLL